MAAADDKDKTSRSRETVASVFRDEPSTAESLVRGDGLAPGVERLLTVLRDVTRQAGPVYLVGGFPRDRLLGRPVVDLDLLVEGDPAEQVGLLAARLAGRSKVHEGFRTAELELPGLPRVDLAGARTERYSKPGALPVVAAGTLRQDVERRDFSINTLLLEVAGDAPARLHDFVGGLEDLRVRRLRVLHPRSFEDDPTRVLRGVRLGARLELSWHPDTAELAGRALREGRLARLSPARLRREVRRIFETPALAGDTLDRLVALGGSEDLSGFLPGLVWESRDREHLERVADAIEPLRRWARDTDGKASWDPGWSLWLAASCAGRRREERRRIAEALDLGGSTKALLVDGPDRARELVAALKNPDLAAHVAAEALASCSLDELALVLGVGDAVVEGWIRRDLQELRPFKHTIRPADLLAAGARPGRALGDVLRRVRRARWDGRLEAEDELPFALRELGLEPTEKGTHRARSAPLVVGLLASLLAGWPVGGFAADQGEGDLRSRILVRLDCYNDIGRREITLFANGTSRLREGPPDDLSMRLLDLEGGELESFRDRLEDGDLSETQERTFSVDGAWVERCDLEVRRGGAMESYSFGRYDSLSLDLSRVVRAAEDLASLVEERSWTGGLSASYQPTIGDMLERRDGILYRVVGFSADDAGVELRGVDEPLVLWVPRDTLRSEFVERIDPE